jgi:dihydroorotate dehydrogenase
LRCVGESGYGGVLGINIGKNFDTPIERAADDYLLCLRKVYAAASYVTVNISSPNTTNLRALQQAGPLRALLTALAGEGATLAQRHGQRRPILVKIAPDVTEAELDGIAVAARECGVDGLIATNTTVSRPGLGTEPLAAQTGGLSGAPLGPLAEDTLRKLRRRVGSDFPLIGVGGILSGADARRRRDAGADLIQIYTGFIYRGPALVGECADALCA